MQNMTNGTEIPSDKQDLLTDNTREINGDDITEEIQNQEEIPGRTLYGEMLYFLMTTSVTRSLLLWPFLRKDGITISDSDDGTPAEEDDYLLDIRDEKNKQEADPSTALVLHANTMQNKGRIFTLNGGILFKSDETFRTSLGVSAFHDTTGTFVNAIWGTFLSSLLINGLVNYFLYPEEREGTTIADVLGISALLNIICIEQIDFFKKHLCFKTNQSYNDMLASSLDLPYIWPVVLGVPLLSGIANAAWQARRKQKSVTDLVDGLKRTLRQHSLWNNYFYWIFAVVIPEVLSALFPPAILLKMLCITQTDINDILEQMRDAIVWNGNISAEERMQLIKELEKNKGNHIGLTQLKVLSVLADIVDGINEKNLSLLEQVGLPDSESIIASQRAIKKAAFNNLYKVASRENENKEEKTEWLNYLYANYLMWRLGYPQNYSLQTLFFPYKLFKLYFTLMFYKTIVGGIFDIINRKFEENKCLDAGKIWLWYEEFNKHLCSVCGDLKIFYQDTFTVEDCFRGYLILPKKFEHLQIFIERISKYDLTNISTLDFSAQTLLENNETAYILMQLKKRLTRLQNFIFLYPASNKAEINVLIPFIINSTFSSLSIGSLLDDYEVNNSRDLLQGIAHSTISRLEIIPFPDFSYLDQSLDALQNSSIEHLWMRFGSNSDKSFIDIANLLPISKILNLTMNFYRFSTLTCDALANAIPQSKLRYLNLASTGIKPECAKLLIEGMKNNSTLIDLILWDTVNGRGPVSDDCGNEGIIAFSELFAIDSLPLLKKLVFSAGNVEIINLIKLFQLIPKTNLEDLAFNLYHRSQEDYNASIVVKALVDAIRDSNLSKIEYSGRGSGDSPILVGDVGAKIISDFLIQYPNKLSDLRLYEASIGSDGIRLLATALLDTTIEFLDLSGNNLEDSIIYLSDVLNRTKVSYLDITDSQLTSEGMIYLLKSLKQSKIKTLLVSNLKSAIEQCSVEELRGYLKSTSLEKIIAPTGDMGGQDLIKLFQSFIIQYHQLYIDYIRSSEYQNYRSITNISTASFTSGSHGTPTMIELCKILPLTKIPLQSFLTAINWRQPNLTVLESCGVISGASSLLPAGPYLFLAKFYITTKNSLSLMTSIGYKFFVDKFDSPSVNKNNVPLKATENSVLAEVFAPVHFLKQKSTILDASGYLGQETIIINLTSNSYIKNTILTSADINTVIGSKLNNHVIIGKRNGVIDLGQNNAVNLLIPGRNNFIWLASSSRNHIMVYPKLGTLKIIGFNHHNLLHIIDKKTVYSDSQFICREINSLAILQLRGTQVQLENVSCDNLSSQITFNNETALQQAQVEVFQSYEPQNGLLYQSLLGICETFLNSVSKSALLTAVPKFVTEILYRLGGFPRHEAEASGREMQLIVTLSMAGSSTAMTSSFLAAWLTSQLTHSPKIISMVSMGASIVTSVAETLWTQDAAFSWIALQMGVAMLGASVGSAVIEKAEEIVCGLFSWGLNKANKIQQETKNYFGFWKKEQESTAQVGELLLPLVYSTSQKR